MPYGADRSAMGFLSEALLASQVGTWETDFGTDRTVANAVTAELFDVDPMQAAAGLPLEAYTRAIHPADRIGFDTNISRVSKCGGLLVVEYRVRSGLKGERWLLARGYYRHDSSTGNTVGNGIVVDITDCRRGEPNQASTIFLYTNEAEDSLDRIATQAIQIRRDVEEIPDRESKPLRMAVESLLWTVGRALAKRNRANDTSTFG